MRRHSLFDQSPCPAIELLSSCLLFFDSFSVYSIEGLSITYNHDTIVRNLAIAHSKTKGTPLANEFETLENAFRSNISLIFHMFHDSVLID